MVFLLYMAPQRHSPTNHACLLYRLHYIQTQNTVLFSSIWVPDLNSVFALLSRWVVSELLFKKSWLDFKLQIAITTTTTTNNSHSNRGGTSQTQKGKSRSKDKFGVPQFKRWKWSFCSWSLTADIWTETRSWCPSSFSADFMHLELSLDGRRFS